jgi:anaerobic ribonucleoside-triphosphate reductase
MSDLTVRWVRKRDGRVVPFDQEKITNAIFKAAQSVGGDDRDRAVYISNAVARMIEDRYGDGDGYTAHIPTVEDIQDLVERALIKHGHAKTAKAYILYRDLHNKLRDIRALVDANELVDGYLKHLDWRVQENSNMSFSLQGLNNHIFSAVNSAYWLNSLYPSEIRDAHINGDIHIHDLYILAVYCCGWDLRDLLIRGFGGVPGKVDCQPPKHFRAALGQTINFFYTIQGESAGAVAFSSFDTYLAPFIRYDGLSPKEVRQALQGFIFNMNVPTRVGFQSLVWEELVVVKNQGRIQVTEIGELVDEQFARNSHRLLSQGHDSHAVANADDVQALTFDADGHVHWAPVKAFVRHRVPRDSTFVRMRTSRGTASVSQAHSMFAFAELNGHCTVQPIAAHQVQVVHGNASLEPDNHLVAIGHVPNDGYRHHLDLVELIDAVPQILDRVRVRLPQHTDAVGLVQQRARERFGGLTAFYLEYGLKDKGCWKQWMENGTLPYRIWRGLGEDEPDAELCLRNSKIWYGRRLAGDDLGEFVRLLGWYIAEGHSDISNGLYLSQAGGENQEEIVRVLGSLGALGRTEETQGWSPQGNPTSLVLKTAGKGLLASLISHLAGTYSTNKVIPWFVYDLDRDYQEELLVALMRGDGSDFADHVDYTTTSKKLSLSLSLLLAMNGYKFSVYENSYDDRPAWNDQYTLRIYKDKDAAERYNVGDLLARACTRREPFAYPREYEYDLSVEAACENFAGGSGLLCFHNTPFTNITMDLTVPSTLADEHVIIGGQPQEATYREFQPEMDLLNRTFAELMLEGDARGRVFTFPIPTYNITRDFDWDNPVLDPVWRMTAKYGIPYFANFVNSDLDPEDVRSMCCRLRLDNKELRKRGGGLFGANPLTGSIGVVTLNMTRLGYVSRDEEDFLYRIGRLMDIAKDSLTIKRRVIERFTDGGLYPYSRHYLDDIKARTGSYWGNHFGTIGLNGMNEAVKNLLGVDLTSERGRAFAARVLDFMRQRLQRYQEETGEMFNLEATPAEGTSYRFALLDKDRYPDIIAANSDIPDADPYYTNSTQLPVDATDDLFQALDWQDELQCKYTGGTVMHLFLGEQLPSIETTKRLVRTVAQTYRLPYFTLTPTFSVCPSHGYLAGEHLTCPSCEDEQPCEVYSRIVGYLRPVQQWNRGKRAEYVQRREFAPEEEAILDRSQALDGSDASEETEAVVTHRGNGEIRIRREQDIAVL